MEKLLIIVDLAQRAYGRWLFQQSLSSRLALTGLTVIIAVMVSALLLGGLYAAYIALLQGGFEIQGAATIIVIAAVLILALLMVLTAKCLQRLHRVPQTLVTQSPVTSLAVGVFVAFLAGLTEE